MNKKKVGILTFHDADNLGAVLQAYALKSVIENKCGVSAEIVDYKCDKITGTKYAQKGRGLKGFIRFVLMSFYYKIKRRGFKKFRKSMLGCSEKAFNRESIKEAENLYDIFITGSDQVWNPECSDSDLTYVLDFVSDKRKNFSYAASIGNYDMANAASEWINAISDYSGISVREKSAVEQLSKAGINDAKVHCDPVMLLSQEEWQAVMCKRILHQKYVLVYLVLPDVNVMDKAKKYAQKHNCKIISNKHSIEFILHNSPSEFLSWVYNADYIFTNSFHGTAFSLIFNKPLYADIEMIGGGVNNRVKDLLAADSAGSLNEMKSYALEYLEEICESN